jgi:type II secretory pathway pseudopilin PulG
MEDMELENPIKPKSKKKLWVVLSIILVILLAGGGYYYKYSIDKRAKDNAAADEAQKAKDAADLAKISVTADESSDSTNSGCVSSLTTNDKTEISTWTKLTNSSNQYSFSYPSTWTLLTNADNQVVLTDNSDGASISFSFLSDDKSVLGIEDFTKTSEDTVMIDCTTASKVAFTQGENAMITVVFNKNDVQHLIMFKYKNLGASISGDIVDAFNLILKTISFS